MLKYMVVNKKELRSVFIEEILPKNFTIKENDKKINFSILYDHINNCDVVNDELFIIEIDIKLNKYRKIIFDKRTMVLETLFLDSQYVFIKKIYYFSENIYKELLIEIATLSDIKLMDKIKFIQIKKSHKNNKYEQIKLSDRDFLYVLKLNQIDKKNKTIYDSLKGSIYMCGALNLNNIFTIYQKEVSNEILKLKNESKNLSKINIRRTEKKKLNSILSSEIRDKYNKINSRKTKFYLINSKRIVINRKILDNKILNEITDIIILEKLNIKSQDDLIKNIIIKLGLYYKKIENIELYRDCKIIYSLIINDSLELNYDSIKNETLKYLYLSLEYLNNIETLNEIVREEGYKDYQVIYLLVGMMLGYNKLNRVYTDGIKQSKSYFIVKYNCNEILRNVLDINDFDRRYIKENYNYIKIITNNTNYYKLIEKKFLDSKENSILKINTCGLYTVVELNGLYYIYLSKKETKHFNRERNIYKIAINNKSKFKSYKINNNQGRSLSEPELYEVNTALKHILDRIK